MDLFNKIKRQIDYNNHYTVDKALNTLNNEFSVAVKRKNPNYANNIVNVVKKLYDEFSTFYRESEDLSETMSYSQRITAKKMRWLISQMTTQFRAAFKSSTTREKEIKNTIK